MKNIWIDRLSIEFMSTYVILSTNARLILVDGDIYLFGIQLYILNGKKLFLKWSKNNFF